MRQQDLHQIERRQFAGSRPRGMAIHFAQRIHVDGGVQCGHAGGIGDIRIRAFFGEQRGGIVMAVDDREHQRGGAVGIGEIETRSALDQRAGRIERTLARGIHQRRPIAMRKNGEHALQSEAIFRAFQRIGARVHIGAVRDQDLRRFRMVFLGRPHQRGFAVRRRLWR